MAMSYLDYRIKHRKHQKDAGQEKPSAAPSAGSAAGPSASETKAAGKKSSAAGSSFLDFKVNKRNEQIKNGNIQTPQTYSPAPRPASSPVYSSDGAFFPKKNPFEGMTTRRPNPFENVPYSDPLTRAFSQQTGWRDPKSQALYDLAERMQNPQQKLTPASVFRSGPLADAVRGPRSRSVEAEYTAPQYKSDPEAGKYIEQSIRSAQNPFVRNISSHIDSTDGSIIFDGPTGGRDNWMNEYNVQQNLGSDEFRNSQREINSRIAAGQDYGRTDYEMSVFNNMTADEQKEYSYRLGKYGRNEADKYLQMVGERVSNRRAAEIVEGVNRDIIPEANGVPTSYIDPDTGETVTLGKSPINAAGRVLKRGKLAAQSGLDMFRTGVGDKFTNYVTGRDRITPASPEARASQQVKEGLTGPGRVAYDVVENAAMMLPTTAAAVAASIAMPEAAPAIIQAGAPNSLAAAAAARIAADAPQIFSVGATMFPMSAGQAYEEALQKGLSPNQARLFATAEGLNQAAGEYLLGGFEDISGGFAKQAVDRVLGDVASDATKSATQQTVARAIQHFLTTPEGRMAFSMGSEAFEEIVQGSVSNALGNVAFGEDNAPISQEDLYSGLVASLSAGLSNARYYATGYANGAGRVYSAEDIRAAANNIITDRAAYQNQAAYDAAMEQRDQMLRQADYVEQGGKLTPLEKSELADAAGGELGEMDRIGRQVKTGRDMQDISDAIKTAQEIAQTDETRARADEISVRAADIAKRRAEGKQVTDAEVGRLVNDTIQATMAAGNERAAAAAEARSRIGFGEQGASVIESSKASGQKLEAMTAAYEEARYNIPRNEAQKQLASGLLSEQEFSAIYQAGIQDRNAFYNNDYSEKIGKIAEKYRPGNMKRGTVTYDGVDIKALETAGDKDSRTKYAQMKTIEHFLSGTLGYNVEWFESKTEDGRYTGENGSYTRSKHLIRLDVNAGADVIGDKVKFASVISHELTHTIEDGSPVQYQKLADSVMKMLVADQEYSQGRNAEQIVADMIENNPYVSNEADAIHELVAQACEDMMSGNRDVRAMFEGMSEAEQKTIFDHIKSIFAAIKNFFDEMLNSESVRSNRTEAAAIRRAKENIEALQKEWTEGVKQAAAYNAAAYEEAQRQSAEGEQEASESDPVAQFAEENNSNVDSFSIRQLAQAAGYDIVVTKKGKIPYAIVNKKTGKRLTKNEITKDVVKDTPMGKLIEAAVQNGTVSEEVADTQRQMFADLFGLIYEYKDAATVWQIASTVMYSGYDDKGARTEAGAVKSNSDPQYGTTIDFGTICAKTQAIIDVMSKTMLEKGRGLTRNEIVEIVYPNVSNAKLSVPCPVCYVFSRWLGVPSLLNTMLTSQERFANATDDEINDYVLGLEKKYGDSKKIGTKKSQISASLTRAQKSASLSMAKIESGKLTEKQLAREQKKLDNALARMKKYDAQVAEIEAYNWVTQVLCETDNSRKAIRDENGRVHRDPDFNKEGSPNRGYVDPDILLDMRRTGEFAELSPKAWLFRTTRGAGMGKAIMPHSGETLGDIVRGSNSGNPIRYSDEKNPFYNAASGDAKTAADGMRDAVDAVKRAIKRAKGQNLIGGLRLQSTSDYRAEWGIDYIMAFFEMQAIGSQGQLYTKVIEAVDFLATTGCEVNLSIMGRGDGYHTDKNGNQVLDFSSVTGIDFDQAYEKTKLYDNVQMILVGLNNTHIRLALADDRIGFVIPWHSSGSSEKTLGALMRGVNEVLGNGTDYSPYQNDIIINEKDKADVRQLRLDILMGEFEDKGENSRKLTDSEKAILNSNKWLKSLYHRFYEDENAKEYGIHLSKDQAEHIFPYEYWDTSLTVDRADENGRRFVEYCGTLGIAPRFSGYYSDKKGQPLKYNAETDFTKDPGYWKLLIDRRMYNRDGTYHEPKAVDVTQLKVNNIETPKRVNSNSYNDTRKINRAVRNTLSDLQRNEEIGNELTVSDEVPSSMASNGTQMSARFSDASRTGEGNTFLKANDAAKNITAALSESGYRYNYYGIRSTDYKANVGDILPASHDLADDSEGEELSGVSATGFGQLWYDEDDLSEVEKALKSHNKTGYEGEYHYLIGGNESEYGNDPSEVLIKDAEVIGIIDRDGNVITGNTGEQMSARVDGYDESSPSITADTGVQHSHRVTDKATLNRLNAEVEAGDYITTYKAMQLIDGKLYPPMAAKVKGEDGKYRMQNASEIGVWQQADEDPTHIKIRNGKGYYTLNKGNGKSIDAAYNPYEHSSNLVLNDQFEEAYKRDNLVFVECRIPKSEIDNPYRAEYAKDATGVLDWKAGTVAGKLKNNRRQVYLSRYLMPYRILGMDEVAAMWKDTLGDSGIEVPFNVVPSALLTELEKAGVPIDREGSPIYRAHNKTQMSSRDSSGNTLTKAQQEYFKDSKARDESGNLLVLYHGTEYGGFTEFDSSISFYDKAERDTIFLTSSRETAEQFKGTNGKWARPQLYEVYANVKNPLEIDAGGAPWNRIPIPKELQNKGVHKTRYEEFDTASTNNFARYARRNGYDGVIIRNVGEVSADNPSVVDDYIVFDSNQVKNIDNENPTESADIRYSNRDTIGRQLTDAQAEYFKDSKARDAEGRLLTLYHGTDGAGFTEFRIGGNRGVWLTTSKRDADSYAGNFEGKLFDPNEKKTKGQSAGGNVRIGNNMRFENQEDADQFLKENPDAAEYLTERELLDRMYALDDIDDDVERDEAEDEYNRLKRIHRSVGSAYAKYELTHSQRVPLSELINNPSLYSLNDLKRAWTSIDREVSFDDEFDYYSSDDEFRDALAQGLSDYVEENASESEPEWRQSMLDFPVLARIPEGRSGEIATLTNRTYELYANVVNPYVFDNEGRGSEGNGRFYHTIEKAMADPQYDGVIVENARVGRYQDLGTVVLVKNPNQIKMTSNENPTDSNDIRYSNRNTTPAPAFYSKLQREIEGFKGNKIGAASVESYLKGKGVKDEEIKWSGIRTFLEGKKSVDKAELLQYLRDNEMQIEETVLGGANEWYDDLNATEFKSREDAIAAIDDYVEWFNEEVGEDEAITKDDLVIETTNDRILVKHDYETIIDARLHDGTNWSEYKLDGGENYREILFSVPGSDYSNQAMRTHWNDRSGVLAHARVQDFNTENGDRVLFVEEIQSDWHNAGQKEGYRKDTESIAIDISAVEKVYKEKGTPLIKKISRILTEEYGTAERYADTNARRMVESDEPLDRIRERFNEEMDLPFADESSNKRMSDELYDTIKEARGYAKPYFKALEESQEQRINNGRGVPDAPFRTTYTDYVLKNLLRMAAEGDYDYLAWTTADMQSERWSDEFAEGYRIEYDQQIPKFLKKYGKQWGASLTEIGLWTSDDAQPDVENKIREFVEAIKAYDKNATYESVRNEMPGLTGYAASWIDPDDPNWDRITGLAKEIDEADFWRANSTESVPAIAVNELMKQSVLTEGQPRFSARDNGFGRNASFGTVEELERRNENIREMNYGLDAVLQNRGTQTRKLSDQQIERIARRFLREYGSKADVETITNGLKSMYEYIDNQAKISAQQVGKIANSFAEQILDESKEVDDNMAQMYPELARDIKGTKLYVSPETMKEMAYYFENAADFRRQAKKFVTISEQRDGARGIDTFYEELSGNFPELFDSEIVNEKDQLLQIMDVAEQLKKKTVNKDWGSEYDEIAYTLGQDMIAAYFAEKGDGSHKRNIDMIKAQMKAEHQEYVDGLRRAKERQIRELKDKLTGERRQNIAKIAELRAKLNAQFRERQDKAELRRLTTQAKARLQKNARNLWSKRGTPEFERLKAKLFSELDLVSVGISKAGVLNLEKTYNDAVRQAALDPDYAASDEYKNIELKFRGGKDVPSIERKKLRDLSYEEIVSLTEDILALKHSQQTYNRMMKDNFKATVAEYGRKGVAQQNIVTGILNQNGFRANALAAAKRYALYMENPVRAAHLLDGYQEDGVLTELFDDINNGTTKKTRFQQKTHEMFEEVLNDKELMDGWSDQNIEIEVRGQKYHISKGMRIAIALHAQNTDNIRHIENGGFNIPNERYYKQGRYTDAYNSGTRVWMSKEDMDRIAAGMTEGEKRFAQIAHNFFNKTAKDAINETSLILKGYELAVVPNYFPIRTDRNFTQAEIDGLIHDGTIEGKGQFKDRQPGAKNPILLEDVALVIDRQTQTTGAYYGIAIPVRDMNKVWNYTATAYSASMKDSIARNWGELGKQTIEKTLTDIQAGARRGDTGDHIFSFLKGAYAASTLVGNIGVSIKQAASYPLAISMIDADCLAKGLTMKTDRAYMDSITPWSWDRRHGMGGEEMSDILKQKGMIARNQTAQSVKNFFNLIQKVDVLTTDHLFSACEAQIQKNHPKLEVRGDEYNKKVAELYNEMLWRTQPSYGVMQRNELMRSASFGMKALTMFKTQTFNMGGEILDAALRAQAMNDYAKNGLVSKAEAKRAAKALGRVMWATVLSQATLAAMTALANAVLRKMRPYRDDKGEVTGASVARKIGTDFVTSWFGLFFGADLAEQGIAAVLNFAQWYDITAPQFDRLNDTVSDLSAWTRALIDRATETDEEKKAERNAKVVKTTAKVAISATGAIGIPAQNIYNMLNAVNLLLQDTSKDGSGFLSFEAGSGLLGLTDTAPTKEQYARQAVYYSERDDSEKVAHALEGTNKSTLEKVLGSKLSKNLYESFLDDPENLAKYMNVKRGGSTPKITDVPDDGYESFTKLREAIGDPERTQNWHHIVEQEQGPGKDNFGNFSATQINNKNNIVSVPSGAKSPHTAISKYYDSVQDFTDGKTVREWLSGKSFEEQFDFGVKQLQKYGDIIPTSNGWVFVPDDEKIEAALPLETGKPDERTETQKQWATKMAELREDGGLSGREVREAALSMLQNGLTAEEALELYKQNQKSDKTVGKWKGSFEDYLKGRNAVDEAKAIKDSDKKRQSERRKDSIESYLRQYRGSREDELLLWKLMGYSENTFEFK